MDKEMTHLDRLEAEAIFLLRETVAETARPVLLYSIGKDSSVLLHLARKAFAPERLPFPLLHIDTTWKFKEMIAFRDRIARSPDVEMLVHTNADGLAAGINPFDHGPAYTDIMKTEALRQALAKYGFTAAFGGARRDEERSRAKERMVSFRDAAQAWDPKRQRPELWDLFNLTLAEGESFRVFPLSNWTEADIWRYIQREQIAVVPLYFAKKRPVVRRSDTWILVDDERLRLQPGEEIEERCVRFRTLGCYPLTGGIESDADTVDAIVQEVCRAARSERTSRIIDADAGFGSMEKRKREGYF